MMNQNESSGPLPRPRDRGAVLPIVLVVSLVLGAVVAAVATYTTTSLRYGQVAEARAGRLAAAHGGMDDTLEQLSIRSSVCSTQAGAGSGVDVTFPETINGSSVTVNCRIATGQLPSGDFFALGVTGEGAPNNGSPTFRFTLGGNPKIGGPVFVHDVSRVSFSQPTTIEEGDLWYPDTACAHAPPGDTSTFYQRSSLTIPQLSFDPTVRGTYCLATDWQGLAGPTPPVQSPPPGVTNPPHELVGSCRVFRPGTYTTAPALGNNNYFMSGIYHFDNVGHIVLQGRTITMGQRSTEGFPVIDNTACNQVRTGVAQAFGTTDSGEGATLYTIGNTRFESRANSGLEISGRRLPDSNRSIGMQVIGNGPGYDSPLLSSAPGAQKEIAIWGQLWAPLSSIVFDTVPAQKAAALRGGAWIARLDGGVSAAASGFVIEVPTDAATTTLVLESTASDDRGTNTVRAVVDYRPTTGEVAVRSRRVLG